jgi:GH25 family lysozyme M1 (1,4-beta-N-acetylmuramidase)
MSDKVLGLDLNDYRKGVPLRQAKSQGVRFVINKATEGTESSWNLVHDTLEVYRAECESLGLPFGAYLYWRFKYDAHEQAMFYLKHLGKVQFPPIVDVERINNVEYGTKTVPIVSIQANRNHLKVVLDTIEQETGMKPMIYTNWATWRHLFGDWDLIQEYPMWVANWRWSGEPLLPVPAVTYVLHQFTSQYKVIGYYRGVDANWFNGNEAEFERYIQTYDEMWNPPPPPPEGGTQFVSGEIIRANGNSELFILNKGDQLCLKVEQL